MIAIAPIGFASQGGDVVLAQLDILAAASGGTLHAVTDGAVDPFVFRLSIFALAIIVGFTELLLARRTSITLEDAQRGLDAVDEIADLMARELGWSSTQQEAMIQIYRRDIEGQITAELA